mmetsp:Transcript_26812/g.86007  ORF Transcript_26812/g.86007 Transcript_26812/m.86007 type:complete len:221 (-) Transcript_26812:54-716(-)
MAAHVADPLAHKGVRPKVKKTAVATPAPGDSPAKGTRSQARTTGSTGGSRAGGRSSRPARSQSVPACVTAGTGQEPARRDRRRGRKRGRKTMRTTRTWTRTQARRRTRRPGREARTMARRRWTDIQGSNGGSGSTAAGGRRACAFAYVAHPPASALVWGRGGGLSFADCWALCVELGLVREPHQSGRAARRRWGREKAVGDGGGPHSSIQNGPSPRPVCC